MQNLLAIGSSHLYAILVGYEQLAKAKVVPFKLTGIQLNSTRFAPLTTKTPGGVQLNQNLRAEIEALLRTLDPAYILYSPGGNVHNVIGLVEHPKPFDFYLPHAHSPSAENSQILPYELVRAVIRERSRPAIALLQLIECFSETPALYISSPPPIRSEELIKARPGAFRDAIATHGIAPATLRLKLWDVSCRVMQAECSKLNIPFLDAPRESMDQEGFLLESYHGSDPTHGNAAYGKLVVHQIVDRWQTETR